MPSSLPQRVRSTSPLSPSPLPRPPPKQPTSPPASPLQPLFGKHSSARLSSSPASSPRIIESPPIRTRSIRPEMSNFMDSGVEPGADFFDPDSSCDEGAWEDDNGTRNFSDVEGLGIRDSIVSMDFHDFLGNEHGDDLVDANESHAWQRGRARARTIHTAKGVVRTLSPFNHIPTRHRRNTNDSVIRADSILNAHVFTMRALESLSPTASISMAHARQNHGKGRRDSHSLSRPTFRTSSSTRPLSGRRSKPAPITITRNEDPDRPKHLPDHFIKTPYPFSAKKEFPKPRTRPRKHDFGNAKEHGDARVYEVIEGSENDPVEDQAKGKHVLGIVSSEGTFDLRSRAQRNEDAQGLVRSEVVRECQQGGAEVKELKSDLSGTQECVLYVSLRAGRDGRDGGVVDRLVKMAIPTDLTTTSPSSESRGQKSKPASINKARKVTRNSNGEGTVTHDFDDAFLATSLQRAYRQLAGNWIRRTFSAKSLRGVRLGQIDVWSGSRSTHTTNTRGLLSACDGIETSGMGSDTMSPFTEHNLLNLYKDPKKGKARYTWVHWARRVAVTNGTCELGDARHTTKITIVKSHLDIVPKGDSDTESDRGLRPGGSHQSDTITTIQFTHSFSPWRIVIALATILILSVLATLMWIFLGNSARNSPTWRGRSERVVPGMAIGGLALLLQMVMFVAWMIVSWLRV